ncbi:hypothetical protein OWV82_006343 [Melia azedarach]|uniref:Uncharacterized protein n=1 Tax=Melia azedarach TaxID=155640 RepID=A0ACC1YI78_MELAZ|nr:hypothetical protein OWV82_006343 [Melia azedarach]
MDKEKQIDVLSNSIMEALGQARLESTESSSKCFIAKVPKYLRDLNEKAYAPQLIIIGPYHREKIVLKVMDEHKLRYLKMLLQRRGEQNVKRYLSTMKRLEQRARACYDGVAYLNSDEFVKMLLLDACFIVELFRKKAEIGESTKSNDPILNSYWMMKKLRRDLLLVENQLPFFVLKEFYDMTVMSNMPNEQNEFLQMIINFFIPLLPNKRLKNNVSMISSQEIKHLLSFIHDHWASPSVHGAPNNEDRKLWKKSKSALPVHSFIRCASSFVHSLRQIMKRKSDTSEKKDTEWEFIRCATELREAGIEFKMIEEYSFDINFKNGIIEIPKLRVEDDTESFFRNLIVYEQFYPELCDPVIDYMKFMDCLMNSAKDVELLCRCKILHNCLGNDEAVASMFNRLSDSVTLSSCNRYKNTYMDVNEHCDRRKNKWMANLRHNYFNTPWTFISFLAALLLLLLTLAQTLFSILPHFK